MKSVMTSGGEAQLTPLESTHPPQGSVEASGFGFVNFTFLMTLGRIKVPRVVSRT